MYKKSYERSHTLPPGMKVFIYAVQCEMFIKIGIALNVTNRIGGLQHANPFPIRKLLARRVRHEVAALAEHLAHKQLASCHHRGEWFLCSKKDAVSAISRAIASAEKAWAPGKRVAEYEATVQASMDLAARLEQEALSQ